MDRIKDSKDAFHGGIFATLIPFLNRFWYLIPDKLFLYWQGKSTLFCVEEYFTDS